MQPQAPRRWRHRPAQQRRRPPPATQAQREPHQPQPALHPRWRLQSHSQSPPQLAHPHRRYKIRTIREEQATPCGTGHPLGDRGKQISLLSRDPLKPAQSHASAFDPRGSADYADFALSRETQLHEATGQVRVSLWSRFQGAEMLVVQVRQQRILSA